MKGKPQSAQLSEGDPSLWPNSAVTTRQYMPIYFGISQGPKPCSRRTLRARERERESCSWPWLKCGWGETVLVWVGCKEGRCQFLVIQAFRDMPGSHVGEILLRPQHLVRRPRRQRGGGAPLPPHGARRGHGDVRLLRLLGAECGDVAPGTDAFSKASPRCTGRRRTATRRSAGCSWRLGPRPRRRTATARHLSGSYPVFDVRNIYRPRRHPAA